MKKNILILTLLLITIFSCKDKNIKNTGISQINGSGFEPNWNITISNKNGKDYTFVLMTMLGEKKTTGNLILENNISEKENTDIFFKGNDSNKEIITIMYKNESCLDMAGNDSGKTIIVKWNNQKLQGCAKLIRQNEKQNIN
ncbi:hypothetical protein [Polaribacter staleyi]|uniref:hypothetical protein n=1 Tax=Polaribacter staleyi TaxID=2022337 RepID=UPI0031BA0B21